MFEWTLMKRLIWIKAAVISGAASLYETVTGAIVSFVALHAKALKKLVVNIEPVQDLHGYDAPWPPGSGKNKLDASTVFTSPTTSIIIKTLTLKPNTQYTASTNHPVGGGTTAATLIADMNETLSSGTCGFWENQARTKTTDANGQLRIAYRLVDGETESTFANYWYQLEEGTTATTFASYANECPISGWTGVKIWATGKNLFNYKPDYSDWSNGYLLPSGIPSGSTPSAPAYERTSPFIPVKGGQEYTLSYTPNTSSQLSNNCAFYDKDKNFIDGSFYGIYSVSQYTRTAPAAAAYFRFSCRTYNAATEYQLEPGSTKTAYEAYSGQEIDVPFPAEPGTVYGGTLDVVSGVLTVDRAYKDMGDYTWANFNDPNYGGLVYSDTENSQRAHGSQTEIYTVSSCYRGVPGNAWGPIGSFDEMPNCSMRVRMSDGRLYVRDDSLINKSGSEIKAAMSGVQLVYKLATPLTIQLTPQEVTTLLGQNNIWADAGDVEVTYYAK